MWLVILFAFPVYFPVTENVVKAINYYKPLPIGLLTVAEEIPEKLDA